MPHKIRYGSVCSGVEAASLAWQPLGWKPVFFAEVEPFPCAVLQQRFNATKPLHPLDPAEASDDKDRKMRESWMKQISKLPDTGTVPNLGDFTKIKGEDYVGAIDLLVGGTPCQDLSVAGKRAGFEGARSSLALDFVRLAYESHCKYFVWENVPGVFSSNGGRDFATLLSMFVGYDIEPPRGGWKTSGIAKNVRADRYGVAWRVLDAQFTRVPGFPFAVLQRRRRVFVVGCFGDWERSSAILLEPDRLSWNTPPRIKKREVLAGDTGEGSAQTIRMRAGCEGGGKGALIGDNLSHTLATGNDQTVVEFAQDVANTVEASCYKGPAGTWNERTIVSQVSANGTSFGQRRLEDVVGTITTKESLVRGDTKLVISMAGGQDCQMHALGNNVAQPLSLNNGGLHYIATYEYHPQDSRLKETEVGPTCGTFGNSIEGKDCIVQSVAIAENIIGRKAENGGNGVGAQEELAYTQNATGVMGVATMERSRIWTIDPEQSNSMKSSNPNSGIHETDVAKTLDTGIPTPHKAQGGQMILNECVPLDIRNATRDPAKKDKQNRQGIGVGEDGAPMHTITTGSVPGVGWKATVRRLLPIECERLMGFPDNHTQISWKGKPPEDCPDAPRYKACGNSMCCNVMTWIGHRIQEVEERINNGEHK